MKLVSYKKFEIEFKLIIFIKKIKFIYKFIVPFASWTSELI